MFVCVIIIIRSLGSSGGGGMGEGGGARERPRILYMYDLSEIDRGNQLRETSLPLNFQIKFKSFFYNIRKKQDFSYDSAEILIRL